MAQPTNRIPPELLSSIIDFATTCDSSSRSYRNRIRTLSSLSLAHRSFHPIAQPLLPTYVHVGSARRAKYFENKQLADCVLSLVYWYDGRWDNDAESLARFVGEPFPFRFVRELNLVLIGSDVFRALNGHAHLKRLSLEHGSIDLDAFRGDFVLPRLEELSLDHSGTYSDTDARSPEIFTTSNFPSLRTIGVRTKHGRVSRFIYPISQEFSSQLDCVVVDDVEACLPPSIDTPIPNNLLFDMDGDCGTEAEDYNELRELPIPSLPRVRIRFDCRFTLIPARLHAHLDLIETFLTESDVLEELYLDFYPRDGRRGYTLNQELKERIRKIEELAKEKNVEIVWESHEDDIIRSLVSKEFWKRCREEKEREVERGLE